MGIFNIYHGIHDVIEFEGANDILIWRHPIEDFNDGSVLVVGPSQEAIFVKHGQILGTLPSGTHTLSMKNYAFLRALKGMWTGGITPYQGTIYFVNKMVSMAIDWGTDSPIKLNDPLYNVPIGITSYGDYAIQVIDGRLLMEKLVGTTVGFTQDDLKTYFNSILAVKLRSFLSSVMIDYKLSGIGIDRHLEVLSDAMAIKVKSVFKPYGLEVIHFSIAKISYSGLEEIEKQLADEVKKDIETDRDVDRKVKKAEVDAIVSIKDGEAQAKVDSILGMSETDKAVAEIGKKLAENPGPMAGSSGFGMGIPGMVGGGIVQPSSSGAVEIVDRLLHSSPVATPTVRQEQDGILPEMSSGGFMEETTTAMSAADIEKTVLECIKKLSDMYVDGTLSDDEYEKIRRKIRANV